MFTVVVTSAVFPEGGCNNWSLHQFGATVSVAGKLLCIPLGNLDQENFHPLFKEELISTCYEKVKKKTKQGKGAEDVMKSLC